MGPFDFVIDKGCLFFLGGEGDDWKIVRRWYMFAVNALDFCRIWWNVKEGCFDVFGFLGSMVILIGLIARSMKRRSWVV